MNNKHSFNARKRLHETDVSAKERRLIFATAPGEAPDETPQAPERGNNAVNVTQDQINRMVQNAIGQQMGNESVRGATTPSSGVRGVPILGHIPKTYDRLKQTHSPLDKSRHSAPIEYGLTGGIIGSGLAAAMAPAQAAAIHPALGKFATVAGGMLNTASASVTTALNTVHAPAGLVSVLSNPLVLGIGGPMLALSLLGKYRISTLKAYCKNNPHASDAQEVLANIEEYENRGFIGRQIASVKEGTKLVTGAVLKPFSWATQGLGWATGRIGAFGANTIRKAGKIGSFITSPIKNAKHIAWGGVGAAAGAAVMSGLSGAASGGVGAGAFGPWAVPVGVAVGAYIGYKKSKKGKSSAASLDLEPAPAT